MLQIRCIVPGVTSAFAGQSDGLIPTGGAGVLWGNPTGGEDLGDPPMFPWETPAVLRARGVSDTVLDWEFPTGSTRWSRVEQVAQELRECTAANLLPRWIVAVANDAAQQTPSAPRATSISQLQALKTQPTYTTYTRAMDRYGYVSVPSATDGTMTSGEIAQTILTAECALREGMTAFTDRPVGLYVNSHFFAAAPWVNVAGYPVPQNYVTAAEDLIRRMYREFGDRFSVTVWDYAAIAEQVAYRISGGVHAVNFLATQSYSEIAASPMYQMLIRLANERSTAVYLNAANTVLLGLGQDEQDEPDTTDIDWNRAINAIDREVKTINQDPQKAEILLSTHMFTLASQSAEPVFGETYTQEDSDATCELRFVGGGKVWVIAKTGSLVDNKKIVGDVTGCELLLGTMYIMPRTGFDGWLLDYFPPAMAEYVAARAARKTQQSFRRDRITDQMLYTRELEAKVRFDAEDQRIGRRAATDSGHYQAMRNLRNPYYNCTEE